MRIPHAPVDKRRAGVRAGATRRPARVREDQLVEHGLPRGHVAEHHAERHIAVVEVPARAAAARGATPGRRAELVQLRCEARVEAHDAAQAHGLDVHGRVVVGAVVGRHEQVVLGAARQRRRAPVTPHEHGVQPGTRPPPRARAPRARALGEQHAEQRAARLQVPHGRPLLRDGAGAGARDRAARVHLLRPVPLRHVPAVTRRTWNCICRMPAHTGYGYAHRAHARTTPRAPRTRGRRASGCKRWARCTAPRLTVPRARRGWSATRRQTPQPPRGRVPGPAAPVKRAARHDAEAPSRKRRPLYTPVTASLISVLQSCQGRRADSSADGPALRVVEPQPRRRRDDAPAMIRDRLPRW